MATYNPPFSVGQAVGQAAANQALSIAKNANKPKRPKQNFLPPSPDGLSQDARDTMAIQNNMMMPSRGFKRAGGDKPSFMGQGMNDFYTKNPQIARGPERANQIAAERKQQLDRGLEAGRAAVDFTKQTKGYTDANGQFVPPTMPKAISSKYGTGSVEFLPPGQKARGTMTDPLTGKQVYMDEYLPQQSKVQDTKYGPMTKTITDPVTGAVNSYNDAGMDYFNPQSVSTPAAQAQKPMQSSEIDSANKWLQDTINGQQISPSGGGRPSLVGAGGSQGAPGGDFLPMPDWVTDQTKGGNFDKQMNDFYKTQYSNPFEGKSIPMLPNSGPQQPWLPNSGPQLPWPANAGPQRLPEAGMTNYMPNWMNIDQGFRPEQQQTLDRLKQFSNMNARLSDMFPGDDFAYLQQMFPQINPKEYPTTNALLDAYRNVAR